MAGKISYKGLMILLIGISVIGTVSTWAAVNNSGIVVPTSTIPVSVERSEAVLVGSGQVSLTILKPENESSVLWNKSFMDTSEVVRGN